MFTLFACAVQSAQRISSASGSCQMRFADKHRVSHGIKQPRESHGIHVLKQQTLTAALVANRYMGCTHSAHIARL
jgi:hypothetical protein